MTNFVEGNELRLLNSGGEYFPALEAACDAAASEIHLQIYIFEDDATGRRIADVLMRAAQRGVAVHLMLDGFGSRNLKPALLEAMQNAGIHILTYRRPQLALWRFWREQVRPQLRRLHHKVAVIDARIAFVGGINIIDDMHTPNQVPPRFDYAVQVEGPLIADIHTRVRELWELVAWTQLVPHKLPRVSWRRTPEPCGTQRAAFVIRNNVRHRDDIEDSYLEAIRSARSEILIASAYFFPGVNFRRELAAAAARGVRVILLLQQRVEYRLYYYAMRALYRRFLDAGIEIVEYQRSFMHAKVAVVDHTWATVGSSNIDPLSLLLAREANVIVEDAAFAQQLRNSLEQAMQSGAQPVTKAAWHHRTSWLTRLLSWSSYEIMRLLIGWSSYGHARYFTE